MNYQEELETELSKIKAGVSCARLQLSWIATDKEGNGNVSFGAMRMVRRAKNILKIAMASTDDDVEFYSAEHAEIGRGFLQMIKNGWTMTSNDDNDWFIIKRSDGGLVETVGEGKTVIIAMGSAGLIDIPGDEWDSIGEEPRANW